MMVPGGDQRRLYIQDLKLQHWCLVACLATRLFPLI